MHTHTPDASTDLLFCAPNLETIASTISGWASSAVNESCLDFHYDDDGNYGCLNDPITIAGLTPAAANSFGAPVTQS